MRRSRASMFALATLMPILTGGCGLGAAQNEHERTVLVDYHYDQFAAVFSAYFPNQVTVRQGDTVVFKQAWSGEPHTVTLGTSFNGPMSVVWPYLKSGPPFPEKEPDVPAVKDAAQKLMQLPSAFSQQQGMDFAQDAAQPCYLDSGPLPTDEAVPCPKRAQPAFTGREAFYNSGVLPYEGQQGNVFRLPVAADAKPGNYYYLCAVHGLLMSGAISIVGKSSAIPSQDEVNRAAQKGVAKYTDPMSKAFSEAKAGKAAVKGNLAGVVVPPTLGFSPLTEFVPKTIQARRGEKVTWNVVGDAHTISFNVPRYGPEIRIGKDGSVHYATETITPQGGPGFPVPSSSGPPPSSGPSPGPSGASASPSSGGGSGSGASPSPGGSPDAGASPGPGAGGNGPPSPPVNVDAGSYDGTRFLSSGLGGPNGPDDVVTYSVTFTKAGTYKFACLVHPLMVGEVDVK